MLLIVAPGLQDNVYCSLDEEDVNKTDSVKRHERASRCFASLDSVAHAADDLSDLLSYKLSPKVFGVPMPRAAPRSSQHRAATHSLEDLTLADPLDASGQPPPNANRANRSNLSSQKSFLEAFRANLVIKSNLPALVCWRSPAML